MTLIVTINGCESIWMLADRRLSFPGKKFKDNARKIAFLETLDGVGIIGYAGLGATSKGTELSDWVSSVLRGRKMKLEQALGVLAGAMERQFKKHMMKIPKEYLAVHSFIVPSIVDEEVKVYAIEMLLSEDRRSHKFQFIQVSTGKDKKRPYRFSFGGSGGEVLKKDKTWIIKLLRLVRNYDKGRVTAHTVADCLAEINLGVHLKDDSVGPNCIVVWRNKKTGRYQGGGGQQFYEGPFRASNSDSLPGISNGLDIDAIIKAIFPSVMANFNSIITDEEMEKEIDLKLSLIPEKPEENLR